MITEKDIDHRADQLEQEERERLRQQRRRLEQEAKEIDDQLQHNRQSQANLPNIDFRSLAKKELEEEDQVPPEVLRRAIELMEAEKTKHADDKHRLEKKLEHFGEELEHLNAKHNEIEEQLKQIDAEFEQLGEKMKKVDEEIDALKAVVDSPPPLNSYYALARKQLAEEAQTASQETQ